MKQLGFREEEALQLMEERIKGKIDESYFGVQRTYQNYGSFTALSNLNLSLDRGQIIGL